MIGKIRNSAFTKFFWGFMGLYLLNISIDPADLDSDIFPENLSFNEQESIVELIVEKILGYEDAFKEYDNPDNEDFNKKNNVKIDLLVLYSKERSGFESFPETGKHNYHSYKTFLLKGYYQIDTPPPLI